MKDAYGKPCNFLTWLTSPLGKQKVPDLLLQVGVPNLIALVFVGPNLSI